MKQVAMSDDLVPARHLDRDGTGRRGCRADSRRTTGAGGCRGGRRRPDLTARRTGLDGRASGSIEGEDSTITTNCSWTKNRKFLKRSFKVKIDEEVTLEGDQFVGWDPIAGQIRSWTFDSEGGIGEGRWIQDGNRWLVKASFVLADGARASALNVYTYVDAGHDPLAIDQSRDRRRVAAQYSRSHRGPPEGRRNELAAKREGGIPMRRYALILTASVLSLALDCRRVFRPAGWSRWWRGGGGGGAVPSVNRSPSMSRPSTPSVSRPSAPSRPSVDRPRDLPSTRPSTPSRAIARASVRTRPSTPSRPSAGQLPSTRPGAGTRPSTPSAGTRPSIDRGKIQNADRRRCRTAARDARLVQAGCLAVAQHATRRRQPPVNSLPGRAVRRCTAPEAGEPPATGRRPERKPPGTQPPVARPPVAGSHRSPDRRSRGRPTGNTSPGVRPPARPPVVRPPVAGRPPRPWYPGHPSHPVYRPGHWWRWATAGAVTGWVVHRWANPIYYRYGSGGTVYYENNVVYVNGQQYGSAEQYYNDSHADCHVGARDDR